MTLSRQPASTSRGATEDLAKGGCVTENPAEENGTEVSLSGRVLNLKTLVSFAIAFAIIIFVFTKLDVDVGSIAQNAWRSNKVYFIMAVVVYYAGFWLRGARWRILLQNSRAADTTGAHLPSSFRLGEMILLNWFANCVMPARLGDAYRGYLLKRNAKVSFSVAMGTIVAERMLDMIVLFVLLGLAALGLVGSKNTDLAVKIVLAGFAMAVVMALGLGAMMRFGGSIQRRLPRRLQMAYGRFQHGTFSSFKQLPLITVSTIVIWLVEAGRLYFVTQSLGVSIALSLILFVALAHSIITVIPFTPGGLGLAEAGIIGLLMISNITKQDAVSIAILDRVISYWSIVVVGFIVFLASRRRY
ncbi:MAG: flippase-like domain-containing protein [Chloroflexi bacterium]|nr:flippase-like domain-containing protein [Chloroflexota bacterium]